MVRQVATTVDRVAYPTALAPPEARKPKKQPSVVNAIPKVIPFTRQ